jgi:predicted nucleic acid-binding protein
VIAFDANILVYAIDSLAGEKHRLALKLVQDSLQTGRAFIPAQAFGEFYWASSRKRRADPAKALTAIQAWRAVARVESYDDSDIVAAIGVHRSDGIPFWDALVWAVCERAGVDLLLSEDFQNRRRLGRVIVLDPFDPQNAGTLGLP